MKERLKRLQVRIDAMTVRERGILFVLAAALLFGIADTLYLSPLLQQQKEITQKAQQDQQRILAMQSEISARIAAQSADPDQPLRKRLAEIKAQSADLKAQLLGMQKGLVSPDKMASLLEDILRRNGHLRLIALKTIPVAPLVEAPPDPVPAKPGVAPVKPTAAAKQEAQAAMGTVYKHAVEMTVEGSYLDMMNYLQQLETMPWQLFWGKAELDASDTAKPKLKLTLFTLSLDQTWLNI